MSRPTRDQLAEALYRAKYPASGLAFANESGLERSRIFAQVDAVLDVFEQPSPSAEAGRTLTEAQMRAVSAAVEGLAIHAEACGHRRVERECPYCDDQATVKAARAALGRAVWGPGEADPADPRWRPPVQPAAAPPSIADMAPGTTLWARFEMEDRDRFLVIVNEPGWPVLDPIEGEQWHLDRVDQSTIRDVTPPPAAPGSES